jgi:hypothetical protein
MDFAPSGRVQQIDSDSFSVFSSTEHKIHRPWMPSKKNHGRIAQCRVQQFHRSR